jgi:membrane-bound lytic murein transglycosylase MltF
MLCLMTFYGPTYARGARWKVQSNYGHVKWLTFKNCESLEREVENVIQEFAKMIDKDIEILEWLELHPLVEDSVLVVLREHDKRS